MQNITNEIKESQQLEKRIKSLLNLSLQSLSTSEIAEIRTNGMLPIVFPSPEPTYPSVSPPPPPTTPVSSRPTTPTPTPTSGGYYKTSTQKNTIRVI